MLCSEPESLAMLRLAPPRIGTTSPFCRDWFTSTPNGAGKFADMIASTFASLNARICWVMSVSPKPLVSAATTLQPLYFWIVRLTILCTVGPNAVVTSESPIRCSFMILQA